MYLVDTTSRFIDVQLKHSGLTIRELQMSDLPEFVNWPKYEGSVLSWANYSATTPQLQEQWYHRSTGPNRIWLTASSIDQDGLIARISLSQPVEVGDLIYGIVVRRDVTGKGYGTQLTKMMLRAVFELTKNDGVWLETQIQNERAQEAWEKIGFEPQNIHYQRQSDFRYHQMKGYRFSRDKLSLLPEIKINYLS